MRRVIDKYEVCHFWANQTQSDARTPTDNLSFSGQILTSYSTPIARIFRKENICLIDSYKYSVTTTSQQDIAWGAASHLTRFEVPSIGCSGYYTKSKPDHKENLKYFRKNAGENLLKSTRARVNGPWLLRDAELDIMAYNNYCKAFKIKRKILTIESFNIDAMAAKAKKARAVVLKAKKVREAKLLADNADKIARWLTGEKNIRFPYGVTKCYLRVNLEDGLIETSQRASIPLSFAPTIWRAVCRCVKNKTAFIPKDNHSFKVGYYTLNSIDKKGNIRVGCHNIAFDQLTRIAAELNYSECTQ